MDKTKRQRTTELYRSHCWTLRPNPPRAHQQTKHKVAGQEPTIPERPHTLPLLIREELRSRTSGSTALHGAVLHRIVRYRIVSSARSLTPSVELLALDATTTL